MRSLWDDEEARAFSGELGLRVYSSRLLGRDKSLVLHGGGNTSVKITETNRFGNSEEILYVKGSGWDLESIEIQGFSPVRLAHVLKLAQLERLSDPEMVNELSTSMTRAGAPIPSIEAILHGVLPHKYVDHTHADAVLSITNAPEGEARIREIYADRVVVIPYLMPGFDLARCVAREYARRATARTIGVVLMSHGIFSFGRTARESYERMISLVSSAEEYLHAHSAWTIEHRAANAASMECAEHAALRARISASAGIPMIMSTRSSARTLAFAAHPEVARISRQGPATPDHVIRTKRMPMLGAAIEDFVAAYKAYFEAHAPHAKEPKTMLDPAPRAVLDSRFGLASLGRTAKDAKIVEELYEHTIDVILRSEALGGWNALSPQELFDVEYWDLEQNKLKKGGKPLPFAGEIAVITGAASGIGHATVESMLARGAAVIALDLNADIETLHRRADYLGVRCDISDETAVADAINAGVKEFGGVDMLVLNAGVFGASQSIESLSNEEWRHVMSINLDANLMLLRGCHPLLKHSPRGGRVVIIGSKNVHAPGPGAAAYSASKAALNQLARVAALEWGRDHIRVNTLHPNAVFDTGLWTDEVLAGRAKRYDMTVEEYKTHNVLGVEVTSRDVAELAAELCGPLFAKTTGAQIPVDGGNERII